MNEKQTFKKCKCCGLESSNMSLFKRSYNKKKDGTTSITYKNMCNKCGWKKWPAKNVKRTTSFLNELKANQPCMDCKVQYPFYVMDFDHLSDKLFNISQGKSRNKEELLREIAKCEIVCSNCHRIRTYNRTKDLDEFKKG